MLVGEPLSRASQTALDFIGNQQRTVRARKLMGFLSELLAHWPDPAFSLNELKSNGADCRIKLLLQVSDVVELHKLHARENWSKGRAIFLFMGGRKRAKGAAMECMLQGKDAPLGFRICRSIRFRVGTSNFQCRFPCFSAAVGEKGPVHAGDLCQGSREFALIFVIKEIAGMDKQLRLLRNGPGNCRVRVAQRIHADAAQEVEVLSAAIIVKMHPPAFLQQHRVTVIRRQQEFALEFLCLLQAHATSTSVPDSIFEK